MERTQAYRIPWSVAFAGVGFAYAFCPLTSATAASPAKGDAASESAKADSAALRIPPDPSPMFDKSQWIFDLRWDRGDVFLLGVHPLALPAPQLTPRAMGRFALELREGPTLIERVRFDFPLLGAGEALDGGWSGQPSLEKKLVTRIGVMFPASKRGTALSLWDRATDRRWPLPWPPQADTQKVDGG